MKKLELLPKHQPSEETMIEKLWQAYWSAEIPDFLRVEELSEDGATHGVLDDQSSFRCTPNKPIC